jgi:hypothetical protein
MRPSGERGKVVLTDLAPISELQVYARLEIIVTTDSAREFLSTHLSSLSFAPVLHGRRI